MAGGRRSILEIFLSSQNELVYNFRAQTTCENAFPILPAEFGRTPSILAHFFVNEDLCWRL